MLINNQKYYFIVNYLYYTFLYSLSQILKQFKCRYKVPIIKIDFYILLLYNIFYLIIVLYIIIMFK